MDDEDSRRGCGGGNYFENETWGFFLGAKPPLFEPADCLSVWTKGQFIPLKQNRNTYQIITEHFAVFRPLCIVWCRWTCPEMDEKLEMIPINMRKWSRATNSLSVRFYPYRVPSLPPREGGFRG